MEDAGGVPDVDLHGHDLRLTESPFFQPRRRLRAPAGCIDDQVGGHHLFGSVVAGFHADTGDAAGSRIEAGFDRVELLDEPYVGTCPETTADRRFQAGAADRDAAKAGFVTQLPASVLKPQEVADDIAAWRATRFQFVHQAREVPVHDAVAAREQSVRMSRLRHAFPDDGLLG